MNDDYPDVLHIFFWLSAIGCGIGIACLIVWIVVCWR